MTGGLHEIKNVFLCNDGVNFPLAGVSAMNVLDLIGQIFKPAGELIDNLHTSEEEKLQQKAILLGLQQKFLSEALHYEQAQMEAKKEIIVAETKADSWLTRSWRPITMLWLLALVSVWWLGLVDHAKLTEPVIMSAFGLVKLGVGGYIASRGVEKVVPATIKAMKSKEQT